MFEEALLKYDKCFPDVAQEVKTKSIKQCIEFYYLWKKIKSDTMKKKWKKVKKRHHNEAANFEPSNLRSHSAAAQNMSEDMNDEGSDQAPSQVVEQTARKRPKTTTSENMNETSLTNGDTSSSVGKHYSDNQYTDNHESLNEIKNQEKYECVKCDLVSCHGYCQPT